jgi:hypothetical protein
MRRCNKISLLIMILISSFMTEVKSQPPCISGIVLDQDLNPVADADLDFDDAETGERIYTPNDNTDQDGFYRVCLNIPGLYNISFAPPPLSHLLGRRFFNVDLPQGETELNVTLDYGAVISGTITGESGTPVGDVDLDADDLETGVRIYTPDDNSDSTGAFWIVVPPSDYRLRFQPPPGTRWIGLQMDSVSVPSDATIDVILMEGNLLSGTVTDNTGLGLVDIKIDLRDAISGEKLYVANNTTDTLGAYSVAVPSGSYNVRFEAPFGSRLVGVELDSVTIDDDMELNQVMESGWLFSVFVHDSLGTPIEDADLDFIQESTGIKLFTPNDKTDTVGSTTVSLLPDTYTVRVDPPPGSIFERATLNGVSVTSDTTFDFTLHEAERYNVSGRVTDISGGGLSDIDLYFFSSATGDKIPVPHNQTDSAGYYDLAVPAGTFNVEFAPPRGSRQVGLRMFEITVIDDTTWSDVVLNPGLIFTASVYDSDGRPVEEVDFDFVSDSNGVEVYTPHDNTDSEGIAIITIPPGIYTIELTPPGPPLTPRVFNGFSIQTDTSRVFVLTEGSGEPPSNFALRQNFPNPFNENTTISYVLFEGSWVEMIIYNHLGQIVRRFADDYESPGYRVIRWDGKNARNRFVSSGVYFYRLKTPFGEKTRRMLLLR